MRGRLAGMHQPGLDRSLDPLHSARRLDEERRKLDEEVHEFHEYLRNLNMAKDREEFDRFMRDRQSRQTPANQQDGPSNNL